jgi:thymidylate kinase
LNTVSESASDLHAPPGVSNFLHNLFVLLDEYAIQYCVLKRQEVISGFAADALELVVHGAQRKELPRLFCNLPRDRYQAVQRIGVDVDADHFLFAVFNGPQLQFVRVDVVYLTRNLLSSAFQSGIFVRRERQGSCWVASADDEFSYLLATATQAGAVTSDDEERLKLLVESLGTTAAEFVAGELFGSVYGAQVVVACSAGVFGSILPTLRHLPRNDYLASGSVRSPLTAIRKGWHMFRNWSRPNGLLITILGPDGAGKTTISAKIFELFGPRFGPSRLLMWRPEVLPRLSKTPTAIELPHSKPPHGSLESLARILATFLDYWAGHFILIKPLLSRSALILYDRDIHDILVDSRRYRYGGPKWVLPLLTNALPRTEALFLVLDAAPEVILKLKQEVPPEEVRGQLAGYRKLAAELPDAHLIRTDGDLEATTSAVARSIVRHLGCRYERRYFRERQANGRA